MQHAAQHQHHARDHGCCHGVQAFCHELQGGIFPKKQVLDGRCTTNCKTCRHQIHCWESKMLWARHRVGSFSFLDPFRFCFFGFPTTFIFDFAFFSSSQETGCSSWPMQQSSMHTSSMSASPLWHESEPLSLACCCRIWLQHDLKTVRQGANVSRQCSACCLPAVHLLLACCFCN